MILTATLSLLFACLTVGAASATTLGDLDGTGASISTADGVLTFENFEVTLAPSYEGDINILADLDLDIFELEVFDGGFGFRILELDGPISAFSGTVGNMVIEFDVVAAAGWQIESVGLSFVATAVALPSYATVTETVQGASTNTTTNTTTMNVIREAPGGAQIPSVIGVLATPETLIHVTKDIVVDTRDGGVLASISEIEQSFETAIPEPGAATLFGFGALLVGARIRRQRAD